MVTKESHTPSQGQEASKRGMGTQREEHHEAAVDEALTRTMATLHGIKTAGNPEAILQVQKDAPVDLPSTCGKRCSASPGLCPSKDERGEVTCGPATRT